MHCHIPSLEKNIFDWGAGHFGALWRVGLFCLQQTWWKKSEKPGYVTPACVKLAELLYKAASAHDQNTGTFSPGWILCLSSVGVASESPIFVGSQHVCACVYVVRTLLIAETGKMHFHENIAKRSEIAQIRCYGSFSPSFSPVTL